MEIDAATAAVIAAIVGASVGFIGGFFTRWRLDKLAERRALLKSMGDHYIANTQADSNQQGNEFWRLGMLQKVGAAELSARELSRLCRRIVRSRITRSAAAKDIYCF
jgi:hypothetical protein